MDVTYGSSIAKRHHELNHALGSINNNQQDHVSAYGNGVYTNGNHDSLQSPNGVNGHLNGASSESLSVSAVSETEPEGPPKEERLVVGVDFGTTYSGYLSHVTPHVNKTLISITESPPRTAEHQTTLKS